MFEWILLQGCLCVFIQLTNLWIKEFQYTYVCEATFFNFLVLLECIVLLMNQAFNLFFTFYLSWCHAFASSNTVFDNVIEIWKSFCFQP